MIVSVETLLDMSEFSGIDESVLQRKLDAVESLIRSYTNNSFQNRHIRFEGYSEGNQIFGTSHYLKTGDTVQITKSDVNDGLYVLTAVDDESVTVDGELFTVPLNRVTKVEYPAAVQEGVINLLLWDVENRDKARIQSETLSRHAVTYASQTDENTIMGYPKMLMGFLRPFMKARF